MTTLALGILSWRAPATLAATLETYAAGGLFSRFEEKRAYFQEISDEDRAIAARFGLNAEGTAANTGIEGGVRALLEGTSADLILLLENDCPLVVAGEVAADALARAVMDMATHDVPVFRMRSRRQPGDDFTRTDKYQGLFGVRDALDSDIAFHAPSPLRAFARRTLRPRKAERFRGDAVYVERDPVTAQPGAVRTSDNGNYLTDSRFLNWSNQSVLVRPVFMLETLLPGVAAHPSKRTIAGAQDIERAANRRWWRDLRVPIGISDPGLFTHSRLDR
jgi:hypothetical protein